MKTTFLHRYFEFQQHKHLSISLDYFALFVASIENSSSILECCLVSNKNKMFNFLPTNITRCLWRRWKKSECKMKRWHQTIYVFEYIEDIKKPCTESIRASSVFQSMGHHAQQFSFVCATNNCWSDALKAMPSLWDDYQFWNFCVDVKRRALAGLGPQAAYRYIDGKSSFNLCAYGTRNSGDIAVCLW